MIGRISLHACFQGCFLTVGHVLFISSTPAMGADANALRTTFDHHYQLWRAHCKQVESSPGIEDRLKSPDYEAIVRLGPTVLPYIIDKIHEDSDFVWIAWAWGDIARVIPDPNIYPWASESILDWWQGGKSQANKRFEAVYAQWEESLAQGRSEEAGHLRKTVRAMGVVALPALMAKLTVDHTDLLQTIMDITGGAADTSGATPEQRIKSCASWWGQNEEKWLIPFPNKRPIANAGSDQIVSSGDAVKLDGSASNDPDKDELRWIWTQVVGPRVQLLAGETRQPHFIAPPVDGVTTLVFQLATDDGSPKKEIHPSCQSGQSEVDLVTVTVKPKE